VGHRLRLIGKSDRRDIISTPISASALGGTFDTILTLNS
jgi:hypothetical protein